MLLGSVASLLDEVGHVGEGEDRGEGKDDPPEPNLHVDARAGDNESDVEGEAREVMAELIKSPDALAPIELLKGIDNGHVQPDSGDSRESYDRIERERVLPRREDRARALLADENENLGDRAVALLIHENMADDDANDPLLETYQTDRK